MGCEIRAHHPSHFDARCFRSQHAGVALSLLGTTQVLALLALPLLMLHRCYNFYTARVGPMLAAVEKSRAAVMKAAKQAQSLLGSGEDGGDSAFVPIFDGMSERLKILASNFQVL